MADRIYAQVLCDWYRNEGRKVEALGLAYVGLYQYLVTSKNSNQVGLYETSTVVTADDLGSTPEIIAPMMEELERIGAIYRHGDLIYIPDYTQVAFKEDHSLLDNRFKFLCTLLKRFKKRHPTIIDQFLENNPGVRKHGDFEAPCKPLGSPIEGTTTTKPTATTTPMPSTEPTNTENGDSDGC
ncbi:MAG: hypothetical protein V7708_17365 [Oceanicoccus sp.]